MAAAICILNVEDSDSDSMLIMRMLTKAGYDVVSTRVDTATRMREELEQHPWDVVISDYAMPHFNGYGALAVLQEMKLDIPFIVVSGTMGEDTAVEMMKAGAHDYLMKENLTRLGAAIEREMIQANFRRDHRRMEETLRLNEERLRLSMEAAHQGLFDLNIQTGEAFVSPEYVTMIGHDPATFVETNKRWLERLHPQDRERAKQAYSDYINGRTSEYSVEFRQRTSTGEWKWTLSTGKIMEFTVDHKPLRMLGMHTDIDMVKKNLEMQQLQTTALEAAANGIAITDHDGRYLWANKAYCLMTGYHLDELRMKTPRILKSGEQDQAFYQHLWQTILSGTMWQGEMINKRKDGSYYIDETIITPVRGPEETIAHFIEVKQDITERKHFFEKIEQQALLLNEAHDAIFLWDEEFRILYWNKGAERIYGWTSNEVIGKDARDLLFHERDRYADELYLLLDTGRFTGEMTHRAKAGKDICADTRLSTMLGKNGKQWTTLCIATDISEKKNIELKLMQTQRMESLGTLAGGIAHDLNNVLAPILLAVDVLKKINPAHASQTILSSVETSARRGADIVKQILSFARGAESQKVHMQPRHLIKEIIGIFKETFPRSITISHNIPVNIWPIIGDPTHFHQLVMNLGVNARDAMPDGGTLSIEASNIEVDEQYARMNNAASPGRYVAITVSDTGIGMPPSVLDHIFEPFYTTKEIGKGTGLGLFTVYTIVKNHNGFYQVKSEVGAGTTFTIYFPASTVTNVSDSSSTTLIDLHGHGELILVVDDEPSIREITKQTLESFHFSVVTAVDGAEGMLRFAEQQEKIALVLTDMMMPVMDGHHLCIALRKLKPNVKIIASSGLIDRPKPLPGDIFSVNGFIDKPYTAETLISMIHSVLSST